MTDNLKVGDKVKWVDGMGFEHRGTVGHELSRNLYIAVISEEGFRWHIKANRLELDSQPQTTLDKVMAELQYIADNPQDANVEGIAQTVIKLVSNDMKPSGTAIWLEYNEPFRGILLCCNECTQQFTSVTDLVRHYRLCHAPKTETLGQKWPETPDGEGTAY